MKKRLLILGCSQAKRDGHNLPALEIYDGPYYRVLRKFLKTHQWPENTSISILSAEHGLFGVIKEISSYNRRMDRCTAAAYAQRCASTLRKWNDTHFSIHVALGKDYLPAIQPGLQALDIDADFFGGSIGLKQSRLKEFLYEQNPKRRETQSPPERQVGRLTYFLPDWDDLVDPDFDFERDAFSSPIRAERGEKHCHELMQPTRMCDGILVSLAQRQTAKGPLRKLQGTELKSLRPEPLRNFYALRPGQYLFGDSGAFSYIGEDEPTISTEQAIALYELYNFDLGASVDHIPINSLDDEARQKRVSITRDNAETFINVWRERGRLFTPVGVVQGTNSAQYSDQVAQYWEMGYRHIAIGGLVPQSDNAILEIVQKVSAAADRLRHRPWLHLFGIYRPNLQASFRELGIDSFDSATYFRKAWLRSDQNYLDINGKWYAAIRVPMASDPRIAKRLREAGVDIEDYRIQEQNALHTLAMFERGQASVAEVLDTVLACDAQLKRTSEIRSMRDRYRRTLEDKPWLNCQCTFCQQLGIHILMFRGGNRNKRRGAHNTVGLYQNLATDSI